MIWANSFPCPPPPFLRGKVVKWSEGMDMERNAIIVDNIWQDSQWRGAMMIQLVGLLIIRFWEAAQDLKALPSSQVGARAMEIWNEFLGPEAKCPVNVDSKSHEATRLAMDKPDRWTFDRAAVSQCSFFFYFGFYLLFFFLRYWVVI